MISNKFSLVASLIFLLLLTSCGGQPTVVETPSTPEIPLEGALPPFRYVGSLEEAHAHLYEYDRVDGKICLISGAMYAGMDVSVSCTGDTNGITVSQNGIRHIGAVYMGNIDVYEYSRPNGQLCTIASGHGHGTLIDISC